MFQVQNEAAFLAGEQKLRLSQKGPYAFMSVVSPLNCLYDSPIAVLPFHFDDITLLSHSVLSVQRM